LLEIINALEQAAKEQEKAGQEKDGEKTGENTKIKGNK
jgi:hypothetical protein